MKTLFTLLYFSLCVLVMPVQAETSEALASARSQLEALSPDDTENQIPRDRYQQLISALEQLQRDEKKIAEYRQLIDQQPAAIETLKKALAKPERPAKPLKLDKYSLTELSQLETRYRAELLALESNSTASSKLVSQNEDKQVRLRETLGQLREQAGAASEPREGLEPLAIQLLDAKAAALNARVQALELELLILPGQTELEDLKLQQLARQIADHRAQLSQIEAAVQQQRRDEAEQALSELEKAPETELELPPELQAIQQDNQRLSDDVRQILADTEQVAARRNDLDAQLKRLDRSHKTIEQQLALEIGYLGGEMRRLMLRVTRPVDTDQTYARINQLRLQNLEQDQAALDAMDRVQPPLELNAALQQRYEKLQSDRATLHQRLRTTRQQLIAGLSELLTIQEAYNEQIRQSSELLNENLLWHPSAPIISLAWPGEIRQGIDSLIRHGQQLWQQPVFKPSAQLAGALVAVAFSALLALLLWRDQRNRQPLWLRQLGNVMHDRISHTLILLVSAPLIAAPVPLLLFVIGHYGLVPDWSDAPAARHALQTCAVMTWLIHSLYLWLAPASGLFAGHLELPHRLTAALARRLLLLFVLATPLMMLAVWLDDISDDVIRSGVGRLVLISLLALLSLFWFSLWRPCKQLQQQLGGTRWLPRMQFWVGVLGVSPVIAMGLALWGYALTAGAMILFELTALLIILAVWIVHQIGLRWLLIEERKLAFARVKARRAEILAARENNEDAPPLEENMLDLQTISDQARVLLKVGSLVLLFSLFWALFSDLLPTLVVLDNVELWSSTISGQNGDILQPITLKDLLAGGLIVGLSLLAAYNLPGLLELLILRHLTLAPGTGYAITTLIKYMLILVGITSGFSQLGFAWEKLQWLVAALSVGLGFGLQEIVANFVSGVIILFEKPIRIGDTVTVGNLSGTVTRIQIRATTITDWDRKEVIIPNKTFITSQLINWSLSDAVTRVVIPVGVAYGSDTQLVRSLLLDVAANNPRLLKDPEPQAFFLGFGDSALNFDLRFYVAAMADRLELTNELNNAIDAAFRAHKIEIPFPQMTVHMAKDSAAPASE